MEEILLVCIQKRLEMRDELEKVKEENKTLNENNKSQAQLILTLMEKIKTLQCEVNDAEARKALVQLDLKERNGELRNCLIRLGLQHDVKLD